MISTDRLDVLEAGLEVLEGFGSRNRPRGRFILLYLGLRRMGGSLAPMGSAEATSASEIERFMDAMLTKAHRAEPFVVLTSPFGGSPSATAPYSARSGVLAPGHKEKTNTWRNNLQLQKGIGCPAEPETIRTVLADPALRLACPHMSADSADVHRCALAKNARYRGEMHSIWLRKVPGGWQGVDLDDPAVYGSYLKPKGSRIPVFPLIAALYTDASTGVYPARDRVGIPELATDFGFSIEQVESIFECDPGEDDNAAVLGAAGTRLVGGEPGPPEGRGASVAEPALSRIAPGREREALPLPELHGPMFANSGLGAELAVANDLVERGWRVAYRGSQQGVGFDLEAQRGDRTLRVEVKSSVASTTPELSESEWAAAREHGVSFVLAIVDFYGSERQAIWYVRDPGTAATPVERVTSIYRLGRGSIEGRRTDGDAL